MSARIGSRQYPPAWGRKKEAEQRAALNALTQLNGDPAPVERNDRRTAMIFHDLRPPSAGILVIPACS